MKEKSFTPNKIIRRKGVASMRKMAIYARQSLDKEDSLSIQKQIDDCKNSINNYKKRTGRYHKP